VEGEGGEFWETKGDYVITKGEEGTIEEGGLVKKSSMGSNVGKLQQQQRTLLARMRRGGEDEKGRSSGGAELKCIRSAWGRLKGEGTCGDTTNSGKDGVPLSSAKDRKPRTCWGSPHAD